MRYSSHLGYTYVKDKAENLVFYELERFLQSVRVP